MNTFAVGNRSGSGTDIGRDVAKFYHPVVTMKVTIGFCLLQRPRRCRILSSSCHGESDLWMVLFALQTDKKNGR